MMLAGKKVVVVGGSSGIGLSTAELSTREGADVIIASRNADRLNAAAGTLGARAIVADVTTASLPVGRVGVGEDVARQILAFMTIGFATGSIVYIDGGALIS